MDPRARAAQDPARVIPGPEQGLLTTGQAAEGEQGARHVSLLTEAAAYIGVILLLVGAIIAIGPRWNDIPRWGQAGVYAGAAVFFLLVGIIVRQVREPAIQRLAGVAWFLSVIGVAGAVWLATYRVHWRAGLGWRRYVEPLWVTIPCGVILALIAPSFAAGHYGWMYAIGIATAAAAMAASVPLRNVPLLALGALAMFGYVTSVAARYLHDSLGVPSALAITGVLILGLAVVSARLMREAHPPKPEQMDAEKPPPVTLPPKPAEPGADKPSHRDLPKAS